MNARASVDTTPCRPCGGPVPLTESGLAPDPHKRRHAKRAKRQGVYATGNGGYCSKCGRLHVYDERINLVLTPLDRTLLLSGAALLEAAHATIMAVRHEPTQAGEAVDRLHSMIQEIARKAENSK